MVKPTTFPTAPYAQGVFDATKEASLVIAALMVELGIESYVLRDTTRQELMGNGTVLYKETDYKAGGTRFTVKEG